MKCSEGKPIDPDTTAIDITHGQPVDCSKEGVVPCSRCERLFCLEHSPTPCSECGRAFCAECMYDHRSDNTAHDKTPLQH